MALKKNNQKINHNQVLLSAVQKEKVALNHAHFNSLNAYMEAKVISHRTTADLNDL